MPPLRFAWHGLHVAVHFQGRHVDRILLTGIQDPARLNHLLHQHLPEVRWRATQDHAELPAGVQVLILRHFRTYLERAAQLAHEQLRLLGTPA